MFFSTSVLATLFAAGQLLSSVQAHVEMQSPIPFRSKFLLPNGPNTDFSMTSPLNADGSNFPCKGYQNDALAPTATLTAGESFTLQLSGSATHNGGSCQMSLSYDGGSTWVVFHSIVGGCPLTETYTIPVPSDIPSGSRVLLAWSWENNTGNREFYMNCAPVTVVGKGSTSFTAPRMYEANIFGGGQCITPGEVDIVYPNPGSSVEFGGKFVNGNTPGVTDISPCSFDNNVNVTVNGGGSTTDPAPADSPASASNSTVVASVPTPATTTSATADADPAPAENGLSTSTVTLTSTGTDTVIVQPTPAVVTNTVINNGVDTPVATAAPAPAPASNGTTSTSADDGEAGAPCSPDGTITCGAGGTTFYMCDHGALVAMGSVAAGTTCSNGQITRKRGLPPHIYRRHHRFL